MAIKFSGPRQPRRQKTTAKDVDAVVNKIKAQHTSTPSRRGILQGTENDFDQKVDQTIRPKTLAEFVGQSHLKGNLDITLSAARSRKEPMDHLLLYGPPGLGKTTLAMVLATEMNTEVHITSAPALERPRDILGILMSIKPGGMLFIDEIHRLNKVAEEILYPAMEDYCLDRTIGKGEAAKTLRVPLPKFTLVGATTKAGAIASPLRDRFGMVYRLEFYTPEELVSILNRSAKILNIKITDDGAACLAARCRGTPRIANRLLRRVRDFVEVKRSQQKTIDAEAALAALDLFDVDACGLDPTDRRLLEMMASHFNGGPVGLEALASSFGEEARTIEDVYEPYLLQAGFIQRTPRGRVLAARAYDHLNMKNTMPQQQLF